MIACRHNEVLVADQLCRGKVDGVIAAETQGLREGPGPSDEPISHLHHVQIGDQVLETADCVSQVLVSEAMKATSQSQCGACLGIDEPRRDHAIGLLPQPGGSGARLLLDHDRHEGRGVEVDDQRRWSATSSLTAPAA